MRDDSQWRERDEEKGEERKVHTCIELLGADHRALESSETVNERTTGVPEEGEEEEEEREGDLGRK